MSRKKKVLMALLIALVLCMVVLGLMWHMRHYVLVDTSFYPKDAQSLDLRDREISIRHYEKLLRRIPGCQVQWNVPFQEGTFPNDSRELTITALTDRDMEVLDYFQQLEVVNAEACTDYWKLLELQQRRPEVAVRYLIPLGTERYAATAETIQVENLSEDEIPLLGCLPKLKSVLCSGGEVEAIAQLQNYCADSGLDFQVCLGGEAVPMDTESVTAGAITEHQLNLLQFLPNMKQLHIREPKTSAESLLALEEACPGVDITWEKQVCGQTLTSSDKELDLSGSTVPDLTVLDAELDYFPALEKVFLGECGIDNEILAAQRELVREKYKLVWVVACGSLRPRTDDTTFMPVRENVYYLNDEEAYNLRYCEDMVCIDIGHMSIHNIDFLEFMPDLEYLILAHTQLQYVDPIRHCKKLKFLELDWSPLKDLTPLKECTALEDLNLGNTFADFAPIGEMTWLKNLWMIDCSTRARYEMTQALPDTRVMVTGSATVANGWRDLENYYEMRDLLGMHYMSW